MTDWPGFYVEIVCHPWKFELQPKCGELPVVIATTQKFRVAVDWGDNVIPPSGPRKWKRVVIGNFKLVDPPEGMEDYTLPDHRAIEDKDYDPVEFTFEGFSNKIPRLVVAYDIDYVPYTGPEDTYTLDPVIIVRPDPTALAMEPVR